MNSPKSTAHLANPAQAAPIVSQSALRAGHIVVYYDGVCGLCSRSVQWIMAHDRDRLFRYAQLQGKSYAELKLRHPQLGQLDSVVVWIAASDTKPEQIFQRTRGILELCKRMPWPWRALAAFLILPDWLLNPGYRLIAANRYRIWGKTDTCRIPTKEERALFID